MKLRQTFILAGVLAVSALTSIPWASRANVIQSFDLSGEFVIPSPTPSGYSDFRPLNGTVTIDTTSGLILSQTSFSPVAPSLPITLTQGQTADMNAYFLNINGQIFRSTIYFNTPSLMNYTGGNLGSLAYPASGGRLSSYDAQLLPAGIVLSFGTATPEPIPEVGSMPLLAAGLGSLALVALFRRSQR